VGTDYHPHMGYQGFPPRLSAADVALGLFTMSKMEFFGQVKLSEGALTYSDYVTTVAGIQPGNSDRRIRLWMEGVLRDRAPPSPAF